MNTMPWLVVGDGLAAHLVSHALNSLHQKVTQIGYTLPGAAWPAAYGIINPIHIRTCSLAWAAEKTVPFALDFYKTLATQNPQIPFFYPTKIHHYTQDQNELTLWRQAFESSNAFRYITPEPNKITIEPAAYIDTPNLLSTLKAENNTIHFINEIFNPLILEKNNSGWQYQETLFMGVIFAEGYRVLQNPWFKALPLKPNKGQVAEVTYSGNPEPYLKHKQGFFFPTDTNKGKVGSTYNRFDTTLEENSKDTAQLLLFTEHLAPQNARINKIHIGFRPASGDRRPVIGEHPLEKGLWILNGLGSRGLSLGPFYAMQLCNHLVSGSPIDKEVSVTRFNRRLKAD